MRFMNNDLSNFLTYLSFKMDTLREQEENPLTLNISLCEEHLRILETMKEEKVEALKKAMPKKANTKTRDVPKVLFKADGCLSVLGESWYDQLRELKLPKDTQTLTYVDSYEDGNPNSHVQIKEWFYGLGWKPRTWKYERNKVTGEEKKIPQVKYPKGHDREGDLCDSVMDLVKKDPAIELYGGLSVISHRISVLNGFMNAQVNGKVVSSAQGFTNTLRLKHRAPVCNLPGVEAEYGEWCRDVLVPEDGYVFVGADVSSLESTTKCHYMYPHDPEYVKEMSEEGFDEHINLAKFAGAITQEDEDRYRAGNGSDLKPIRKKFKPANYAGIYGVQKKTLSRQTGMTEAESQDLLDAYWNRNWAVKQVAKEQYVKTLRDGSMYLKNPINGFYYSLRNEKDIFSTLNQGSGDYVFNVWLMFCRKMGIKVHMNYHDEWLTSVPQDKAQEVFDISEKAMVKVNEALKLNKTVTADAQAGYSYAECH